MAVPMVPSRRQLFQVPAPLSPASAIHGVVLPTSAPPGQAKAGTPVEASEQFHSNDST